MEEDQHRPASRRFWEEGPAVTGAPVSLSPPLHQQHQRDVNMRNSSSVLDRPQALQATSRIKISPAVGGGGSDVHGDVKQGSSDLHKLAFMVEDVSYSCPDGPARSLEEAGKTSCWKGGAGDSWVLLQLSEKALLSFLRVRNRSTSEVSIAISVQGKRRRDFVTVKRGINLAHGAVTDVKIGHLPCVYIRLECLSRGASGVSLHELAPVGIPARCVGQYMGPFMEDLTYKSTERLLFGPSLKTSLAPVCPPAALKRLVLPPSFLRPEGASYDADDPDPVRKGPPSGTLGAHALLQRHRHDRESLGRPPPPPPPPPPGLAAAAAAVAAGGGGGGGGGGGEGGRDRLEAHGRPFSSFPGNAGAGAAAAGAQYFGGVGNLEGLARSGGDGGGVASSPASYAFAPQQHRHQLLQRQQQQQGLRRGQPSYSSSSGGSGSGSVRFAGSRTGGGGSGGGGRFAMASAVSQSLPHWWSHDELEEREGGEKGDEQEEAESKEENARGEDPHVRSRPPEADNPGSGYHVRAGVARTSPAYSVGRREGGGSGPLALHYTQYVQYREQIAMSTVTWILTVVISLLDVVWVGFTLRLWMLRHKWEIKQRSPELVCTFQLVGIVMSNSVLLHWLLLSADKSFPCPAAQLVSYASLTYMGLPAMLRMVKVVVAYFREYRIKYGRFVKRNVMLGGWAVSAVGLTVRGWIFYGSRSAHYSRDARECFFFDDNTLQGIALLFGGIPALLLVKKLVQVHDAFHLRQEMLSMMGSCVVLVAITTTIQVLVIWGALPDSRAVHVVTEVCFMLLGVTPAPWSLVVPIARYHGWGWCSWRYRVVPVDDGRASSRGQLIPDADCVIDFACKGGVLAKLFGQFCERNLCSESWEFVVEAVHYETGLEALLGDGEQHQHDIFLGISDQFLKTSSPSEINISAALRSSLATFRSRDIFSKLDPEARRTILRGPLEEIARVLEQNLLQKFRQKYNNTYVLVQP
eukprot:g11384.t1